jgi:hypothetical protein
MRSFTAFCTFIEGAHFDLAHTLARHAEFAGKLFERDRLVGQPPRLENTAPAIVEHGVASPGAEVEIEPTVQPADANMDHALRRIEVRLGLDNVERPLQRLRTWRPSRCLEEAARSQRRKPLARIGQVSR